jgi:hypothetical protein
METQQQSDADRGSASTMALCILEWAALVRAALEGADPMPLASVARRIPHATTNEVAMALGWLAHEGTIWFRRRGSLWEIGLQAPAGGRSPSVAGPQRMGWDEQGVSSVEETDLPQQTGDTKGKA